MGDGVMDTLGDARDPAILLIGDPWPEELRRMLASGGRFIIHIPYGAAVLDLLGRATAHLAAVGAACPAAQRIAAEHPDRVESLTLVSPDRLTGKGSAPTLVIHGTDDSIVPYHEVAAFTRELPEADVLSLDGVGHEPLPPEAWAKVVRAMLRHTSGGWDAEGDRLAARSIEAGDPTGWFNQLYAAGEAGAVTMPWDRTTPHPLLAQWAESRKSAVDAGRAIVVGCGLGADARYLAQLGYETIGFDIAEAAIRVARQRFPASGVEYVVADLLDLPEAWLRAFDLVVEIITVQALPDPPRGTAIVNVGRLVAPGGTLLVVALRSAGSGSRVTGPPFPLTREEIEAFATDDLTSVRIEETSPPGQPDDPRWRAEFRRPRP
jgi:SAM-dependent methyltransferase